MNKRHFIALALVNGVGPKKLAMLLKFFNNAEACLSSTSQCLRSIGLDASIVKAIKQIDWRSIDDIMHWSEDPKHHILTWHDKAYPNQLKQTASPPPLLFLKGDLSLLNSPQIAIIGTRQPSPGGKKNAISFATELSGLNFSITSGLAKGIDVIAHRATLKSGGKTLAVLGSGIERIYPSAHTNIAKEIAESGLLISEFPLNTPAKPHHFPQRNRIISGLSLGVLVVEAAIKSGSLITARLAAEEGREVFAIPGAIANPMVKGCHHLIKQGAKLTESIEDVLIELSPAQHCPAPQKIDASRAELPHDLQMILNHIDFEPTSIDEICLNTGINQKEISEKLVRLELNSLISHVPGGYLKLK